MRILLCSSCTIRLFSKICWTKYVFPLWLGPTTNSENLWRKLNYSGYFLAVKEVVACTAFRFLAACNECALRLLGERFSPVVWGLSEFVCGDWHDSCHDDTCVCLRTCCFSLDSKPWTFERCADVILKIRPAANRSGPSKSSRHKCSRKWFKFKYKLSSI
jgi:hypothetical protein